MAYTTPPTTTRTAPLPVPGPAVHLNSTVQARQVRRPARHGGRQAGPGGAPLLRGAVGGRSGRARDRGVSTTGSAPASAGPSRRTITEAPRPERRGRPAARAAPGPLDIGPNCPVVSEARTALVIGRRLGYCPRGATRTSVLSLLRYVNHIFRIVKFTDMTGEGAGPWEGSWTT